MPYTWKNNEFLKQKIIFKMLFNQIPLQIKQSAFVWMALLIIVIASFITKPIQLCPKNIFYL